MQVSGNSVFGGQLDLFVTFLRSWDFKPPQVAAIGQEVESISFTRVGQGSVPCLNVSLPKEGDLQAPSDAVQQRKTAVHCTGTPKARKQTPTRYRLHHTLAGSLAPGKPCLGEGGASPSLSVYLLGGLEVLNPSFCFLSHQRKGLGKITLKPQLWVVLHSGFSGRR